MLTASAQQYKSKIAFYCHSLQHKIVSGSLTDLAKLVNLRTSFVICQEPLGHISCSSPLSPRRGDRFTLRVWDEKRPACICLCRLYGGLWYCGRWAACFPLCPTRSGTKTASCRIPGQWYSWGNCICCSGDCSAQTLSATHSCAVPFPYLWSSIPQAPHNISTQSLVLVPSAPLGCLGVRHPAFSPITLPTSQKKQLQEKLGPFFQNLGWSMLARPRVLEGPRDSVQHIVMKLQLIRHEKSGQDTADKWGVEVSMKVLENHREKSEIITLNLWKTYFPRVTLNYFKSASFLCLIPSNNRSNFAEIFWGPCFSHNQNIHLRENVSAFQPPGLLFVNNS